MGKKDNGELPPPLTRKSSRAEMWENLEAMGAEIDAQQREVLAAREALKAKDAELADMRAKLASAYLRLNVIRAALAHSEAA